MYRASLNFVIYSFEFNSKNPQEPHYSRFRKTAENKPKPRLGNARVLKVREEHSGPLVIKEIETETTRMAKIKKTENKYL